VKEKYDKNMILEIFNSPSPPLKEGKEKKINNLIEDSLREEYGLDTVDSGVLKPIPEAYEQEREQFNASFLLEFLIEKKKEELALWIIKDDIYVEGMNFIFGLAMYYKGAVLSIFRLNSEELIKKEAIHEIGHVLGLEHCENSCVMKFSNSLYEAELKPLHLCEDCKRKLRRKNVLC
jgi:archaemetzincin